MEANGGGGADQDKGIKGNFAKTLLGTTTIDWWTKKFCFDAAMKILGVAYWYFHKY